MPEHRPQRTVSGSPSSRADGPVSDGLPPPNVHPISLFAEAYGQRPATFYVGAVAEAIQFGMPGLMLDLGAGTGLFTEMAHRWGIDVVGIEGSEWAVAEAKARVPGMRMLSHDLGTRLPFADGAAATIVLSQVVEHLDRQRYLFVLSECQRVLAPGGVLLVYSPSRRNRRERDEVTHINMLLPSELATDLAHAGFTVFRRPNGGFWLYPVGHGLLGRLARLLMTVLPHDWISETANAFARKNLPSAG